MSRLPERPALRQGLDLLAQAAPGMPGRHLLRNPQTGTVLEFDARDAFIVKQCDGTTTLPEIQARFQAAFNLALPLPQLEAFIRYLDHQGLLTTSPGAEPDNLWATMKPLRFPGERTLNRLARLTGWFFSKWAVGAMGLLAMATLGVLSAHWAVIWFHLEQLFDLIAFAGYMGETSFQGIFRIVLVAVLVPFARELAKAVAARRMGLRVPGLRYTWFMRIIPRCAADLSGLVRLPERGRRLSLAAAGMYVELSLFCLALLAWENLSSTNPLHDFAFSIALGTTISFILNAAPAGRQDGGFFVMIALEEPDFRNRAIRVFRAWLCFQPAPEPLSPAARSRFILYGALADVYTVVLNVALLTLAGFLLTSWLEGLGAVIFLVIVVLRFESEIRRFVMSVVSYRPSRAKWRNWIIALVVLVLLTIVFFIPYPYEVGGEFRVQPGQKAEVRAGVKAQIEAIPVAEGMWVTNGQPLVILSKRMIQRDLDMVRASLERERNELRAMEAGAKPEELARAEQDVKLRETAYEHAVRRHERQLEMFEKKHISPGDYEEIRNMMNMAREELELSRRQLEMVQAGVRPEQIEAQRSEVQRLQVNVDHLEEDLTLTLIASPIEGRITTLFLQGRVGEVVDVGAIVAMVEDSSRTAVRIAVPEQFSGYLRTGAPVRARPWAYHNRFFTGEVASIAPIVIERTDDIRQQAAVEQERGMMRNLNMPAENVVPVIAIMENDDGHLKTEMTGFAKIEAGYKPLGIALLSPVIRFVAVRVWSWIP
ncbi:MAG TPA: HlyD family efflux transporter periplasmic adaptor subunit [Kiritimatiellia bacterium]|nr:HlyD family efflux transporter periplasmic adaptor subunit [Kiritimatiellia bacterium]